MSKKITPRGKYILIERDEPASHENEHGLITPMNVEQEQKAIGTVIAVGPELKDMKKGDRVIYGAYAGEEIEFEEKGEKIKYRLVHDDDVLAFINK